MPMKKNERLQALYILSAIFEKNQSLTFLLANQDVSALTKEICFGVCRQYYILKALANQLLAKEPKSIDIWLTLIIGLYQLHFLRIPDYAVVKETVGMLKDIRKNWAKGVVNAVLRRYCREKETLIHQLNQSLAVQYSHPEWLVQEIQKAWPLDFETILAKNNEHPPMSLRVNHLVNNSKNYLQQLEKNGLAGEICQYAPKAIRLIKPCQVNKLPGFSEGHVFIQDEAAQLAAPLLQLQPNLRILDACSAPGGKTTDILESEPKLNQCIALDCDKQRIKLIHDNLARLKLNATVINADALTPNTWWDRIHFDRILLDAPCSATGVIRRHPDIKLLRLPSDIDALCEQQQNLLHTLWPLLKKEGLLVYAVCSLLPREGNDQIEKFLKTQPDATCLMSQQAWGRTMSSGCKFCLATMTWTVSFTVS